MKLKLPINSYLIQIQKDPDSDDLILPIPFEILKELKWVVGDIIKYSIDKDGNLILSK